MNTICENCPIPKKAEMCCGVHPVTDEIKYLVRRNIRIQVCINLGPDGSCNIYYERPTECRGYGCEEWYARGLSGMA